MRPAGLLAITIALAVGLSVVLGPAVGNDQSLPLAAFTYDPCVMCAAPGDVVFFSANYSIAAAGTIVSYTWSFGDGTPLFITNSSLTTHMFPGQPGEWKVTLTVEDSSRQIDTISQLVIFNIAPRFTVDRANAETGQEVTFNATSTRIYFQATPAIGFFWSFGDGSNSTGGVVGHRYTAVGIYRVVLSVLTTQGNATISKTIMITQDPPLGTGGGCRCYEL